MFSNMVVAVINRPTLKVIGTMKRFTILVGSRTKLSRVFKLMLSAPILIGWLSLRFDFISWKRHLASFYLKILLRKRLSLVELGTNQKPPGLMKINFIALLRTNQSSCKKSLSITQDWSPELKYHVIWLIQCESYDAYSQWTRWVRGILSKLSKHCRTAWKTVEFWLVRDVPINQEHMARFHMFQTFIIFRGSYV